MYLNRITLSDFKSYAGVHTFTYNKINLISGGNGIGKSTLALHGLLFVLYGHSEVPIASLTTKLLANPKTYVEIELEHLGKQYIIKRSIPTNIDITVDGIKSTLVNNTLKQKELENIFKDVTFFKQFRMVDIIAGINILEQGNQALRKTLVSFDDAIDIGTVRTNLLGKLSERSKLNKDENVLFTHYPSDARLTALKDGVINLNGPRNKYDADLRYNENVLYDLSTKLGSFESHKRNLMNSSKVVHNTGTCPFCRQSLPHVAQTIVDVTTELSEVQNKLNSLNTDINNQRDIITHIKSIKNNLVEKQQRGLKYIQRLEARLQQKDFIYTTKDVEVIKCSVKELDGFTTFYITEKLQRIEPLINALLGKLGFTVTFDVDDKSNFDITLINNKNGTEFKYKELSNGQRLFVTVAFQLALLMEKNESGLIIADECFSSLSLPSLEQMFELFKNSPFQLVSIVHRFTTSDVSIKNIQL